MKKETIIAAVLAVILLFLVGRWSANRDRLAEQAAKTYEACVVAEYGTTPSAWYLENGEYPVCE